MTAPAKRVAVTYAGRRATIEGKLHFEYVRGDGEEMSFKSKMHTRGGIGSIQRLRPHDVDGGTWSAAGLDDYAGQDEDEKRVAAWTLEDRAAVAERDRAARLRKDSYDRLLEILEPLRAEYRRTNGPGRRAMLATIIEYVTR